MKLLHIVQDLHGGGVTNVIVNLIKSFYEFEVENIVISPIIAPKILKQMKQYVSQIYLIGGHVSPTNSFNYIMSKQMLVKRIFNREKPDVIVIQPGWLSLYSYFLPPLPIIVVVHGTYLNEIKYMRFHPLKSIEKIRYTTGITFSQVNETFQLKLASSKGNTVVAAVSRNTRRELIQLGIEKNKVISIINGVDKEEFKPINKEYAKTLVEEMFGVKLKNKVLLHVNPASIKGTHILIKSVAMLRKLYGDDFILLIAGELSPKTYREYIVSMIKGLKLEDNIKLLGNIEHVKMPILYNAADLTVVSSYSEGSPLVIPESLACGTPVVATNVGGNPEYLELVRLKDYLVNIMSYDFHRELCIKIVRALDNTPKVDIDRIPSWKVVGLKYLRVAEYFSRSLLHIL